MKNFGIVSLVAIFMRDLRRPLDAIAPGDEVEDPDRFNDFDLGSIEPFRALIVSALSQLKLGADLTKVWSSQIPFKGFSSPSLNFYKNLKNNCPFTARSFRFRYPFI